MYTANDDGPPSDRSVCLTGMYLLSEHYHVHPANCHTVVNSTRITLVYMKVIPIAVHTIKDTPI